MKKEKYTWAQLCYLFIPKFHENHLVLRVCKMNYTPIYHQKCGIGNLTNKKHYPITQTILLNQCSQYKRMFQNFDGFVPTTGVNKSNSAQRRKSTWTTSRTWGVKFSNAHITSQKHIRFNLVMCASTSVFTQTDIEKGRMDGAWFDWKEMFQGKNYSWG